MNAPNKAVAKTVPAKKVLAKKAAPIDLNKFAKASIDDAPMPLSRGGDTENPFTAHLEDSAKPETRTIERKRWFGRGKSIVVDTEDEVTAVVRLVRQAATRLKYGVSIVVKQEGSKFRVYFRAQQPQNRKNSALLTSPTAPQTPTTPSA
jgi:hypothetical protein